ncbi:MAG: transporter substrate-binding domain-containing protein, partial [Kiritimatiellia bacterium]|nr:transporter substrate-binding domain-containing protein [Kiritimatiellia bacterium]
MQNIFGGDMNGVDIRESSRARDTVHSPGFRHRRKRGATVAGWLLLLFATTSFTQGKPPILSASEAAYPPFCLVDAQNRADGFSVELLRAAIQAMGREADFRVGEWAEIKGWLERGEVQALPLVGRTPEREALFDFSVPYMTLYGAIVVRTDQTGIENLDDLRGKRVAVMKGDNAEEFLRREDRGVEIHTTPTFEQALRELAVGRHDAVVIQRLVALRLLAELRTDPLRVIPRPIEEFRQDFCFAVREGDSETLALINEGLALAIADGTYRRLHSKWFAALQLPSDRRIVVGGDHNFPPYEYLNARGEPEGFAVDLIRAISRETGLEIEIRLGPWARAVRALETGEVDLLQGIFYSEERSRKFDFTLPHASQHYVSVVRAGSGRAPESFEELRGHRLVAQEGDLIQAQLESHGLLDPLLLVETQEDVLRAVAEGRADYGLVMRLSALRLMDQGEWAKLVLGKTPVYSAEYCMAVTKGNSALLTQINEGLRLLQDSGEYRRIQEKWMGHLYEGPSFWRVAGTYLLWFAIPLLGVLLLVLLWIRLLRREVASRTRELRDREQLLSVAGQLARFGAWSVDLPADRVNWSDEVAEIHGVPAGTRPTIDEAISFYMPEDRDRILRAFNACAQEGVPYDEVLRIEPKSGPRIWIRTLGIAHRDSSGRIVRVAGAFQDISEPKKAAEALQASEAQYRHLIENIQEIIFTLNLQGEFSFVSPSWTPLLGHRVQDVQGQPFQIFVHPEDVSICESAFEIVTRTGVRRDGIIFRAKHMGG